MTAAREPFDLERLRALAEAGARWAVSALEQMAGRKLAVRQPRIGRSTETAERGPWETGMFFEVQGDLTGVVGLLLTAHTREVLVKTLLGGHEVTPESAESALRELGNIVASQAVSAMADQIGGRLLPSVPTLATREADAALASLRRRHEPADGVRLDSLILDRATGLRALLVFAPDPVPHVDPGED